MTKVRNFALLRRLRDLLQSEDTAQFPANLNTDQILAVVNLMDLGGFDDLPAGPFQEYTDSDTSTNSGPGAGASAINRQLLELDPVNDRRILTLGLQLDGGVAAGIYPVALQIQMFTAGAGTGHTIAYLWPWCWLSTTAAWTRVFALGGTTLRNTSTNIVTSFASTWNGFLPANHDLWASALIIENAGAVFPADVNLQSNVKWTRVPRGRMPPG